MMQEDPAIFIQQTTDKIGHIQFADCPGRHEPGTGNIDYQQVFSFIKASTYDGWVGAEYQPLNNTLTSLNWLKGTLKKQA